jgi:hypothetical protein
MAVASEQFVVSKTLLISRGSGALSFRNGPWGAGIPIPTSSVKSLRFMVRSNADLPLIVGAGNDTQNWFSPVEVGAVPAGQWTLVEVPISKLAPSGAVIHKFYIGPKGGSATTELHFEEIAFTLAD